MVRITVLSILILLVSLDSLIGQAPSTEQIEFFEKHIRPVLAEKCYKCHNSVDNEAAGLALDFRDGIQAETEHGFVVVPGDPANSVLMKVIRHEIDDVEMPEDAGKLDENVIAKFEEWIRRGAVDPRDTPPSEEELARVTSWQATLATRKTWWSLQPIRATAVPQIEGAVHPVDCFVRAKLAESNLAPAEAANRRTLIRRLSYVLTGLPPSVELIHAFVNDEREDAYERIVDQLLASERFGERWARHWMDLMRYADSHGSEGDPAIPEIYRYRDYLIRAFNQDVPYDQLLREHVAGDLLVNPRINESLGINESLIGPAHWRLVFHGFAPTDALDEKVRFTDDQINVFSKAFLGLTVSCARCHDHKFDAISQADYYALFGTLASCRPTLHDINLPEKQAIYSSELAVMKETIRRTVSDTWLNQLHVVEARLSGSTDGWSDRIASHASPHQLFYSLADFNRQIGNGISAADAWQKLADDWQQYRTAVAIDRNQPNAWHWDFTKDEDYESWFRSGNGLPSRPSSAGDFRIESRERVIASILPAGVNANTISTKHRAFLGSPRFKLDDQYKLWFRVSGGGRAMTRYAVEHYPRDGTVYPIRDIEGERWLWQEYDLRYWQGDYIHLEVNTARDAPLRTRSDERSWFSIREVVVRQADREKPVERNREFAELFFGSDIEPNCVDDVVTIYVDAIQNAIQAWRRREMTDAQALLLDECLLEGLLDNSCDQLPIAQPAVAAYLELEDDVPTPTRVPGVMEADVFDQPLFERGDHRRPTEAVPRRFLEAIDPEPFRSHESGRRELADRLIHPQNPLVPRVMANRIWHYVFGQGIVPTPDNFGQLGQRPSHPELLDYLASQLARDWSIKNAIRLLVTSETFQQQSRVSATAAEVDPANRLLSHANVRRMEAEAIRDTLLSVSGALEHAMYGPGFAANSKEPRRAVYIRNRRNSLDQFLETFNAPVPFATTGRRSETNIPAQSLTMLNSPFVMQMAREWAQRWEGDSSQPADRIAEMFERAIGRIPTPREVTVLQRYVQSLQNQAEVFERKHATLAKRVVQIESQLAKIVDPVRDRLVQASAADAISSVVAPVAAWDFDEGLLDSIGELHGTVKGDAKVENGALVLSGGFVATPPIPWAIKTKTFAVRVQLDDLQQQGGGVITLQTVDGKVFDSIVFGERQRGYWMSGSDGFARTDDFGGPLEKVAAVEPVHFAITYRADGTIRGYRNGEPYGKSIRKSPLQAYESGNAQVLFGLRHGDGGQGRLLRGKVLEAQLFDRALSPEEVASLAKGVAFVSDKMVLAELTSQQRNQVEQLRAALAELKQQRAEVGQPIGEQERWARIAHALFNLKEFIYCK